MKEKTSSRTTSTSKPMMVCDLSLGIVNLYICLLRACVHALVDASVRRKRVHVFTISMVVVTCSLIFTCTAALSPESQHRIEYLQEQQLELRDREERVDGDIVDIDGDEEGKQNQNARGTQRS